MFKYQSWNCIVCIQIVEIVSAPGGGGAGAGEHFSVQFVGRFHPGRTWTGAAWRLEESARKLSFAPPVPIQTRLQPSFAYWQAQWKISCEAGSSSPRSRPCCKIAVICPRMPHLVAHISISVAILTLLPAADHLD